jgi:hypothetical protein
MIMLLPSATSLGRRGRTRTPTRTRSSIVNAPFQLALNPCVPPV